MGNMIAVYLGGAANALTIPGGEPAERLHLTICMCPDPFDIDKAAAAVERAVKDMAGFPLEISGFGRFTESGEDTDPIYASVDSARLQGLRRAVIASLEADGIAVSYEHGYSPHVTIAYVPKDAPTPQLRGSGVIFPCNRLWVCSRDEESDCKTVVWMMGVNPPMTFAHDEQRRQEALEALKRVGSIRKAALETGVPKSTIHRWSLKNISPLAVDVEGDHDAPPIPPDSNTVVPIPGPVQDDMAARQDSQESQTATEFDPTTHLENATDIGWQSSPGNLEELDEPDRLLEQDAPTHRLYLEAIWRYIHLLRDGVHPEYAAYASKQIDPSFNINPDDAARIQDSLEANGYDPRLLVDFQPSKLQAERTEVVVPGMGGRTSPEYDVVPANTSKEANFSEVLRFAAGDPPGYVKALQDDYSMSASDQRALEDHLYSTRLQSYTQGVNDSLTALGEDPIRTITDPDVLAQIRGDAQTSAQGITDTWNRDVANKLGATWLDSASYQGLGATGREDYITAQMDQWHEDHAAAKADVIDQTEVNAAYNQAVQDFHDNNGTGDTAHVTPDDCVCQDCQDLVDLGEIDMADAMTLDLPLHPNCVHYIEVTHNLDQIPEDVWSGQSDEASAETG